MDDLINWFTSTPQGQFLVGVAALVFGSRAILSEDNLKGKFWGLGWLGRWWRRRQRRTAEIEVAERKKLRREVSRQHRYILWLTATIRGWEIWAADSGHTLPPPKFLTYTEWVAKHYPDEDNDDDESED